MAGGRQGVAAGADKTDGGLACGAMDAVAAAAVSRVDAGERTGGALQSVPDLQRCPVAAKVCMSLQQSASRSAGSRSPAASMACMVASIGHGAFSSARTASP